jgi:hypothetical protein
VPGICRLANLLTLLAEVDVVCINQCDLEERAIEVKRMAKTFGLAITLHAWLEEVPETEDNLAVPRGRGRKVPKLKSNPRIWNY